MSWLHGTGARLRLLFARQSSESRMDREFQFHIEMETERLAREFSLEPNEARRRALVTFGGMEKHREALRDGRGAAWLGGLSLDFKLGLRMLAKYPGLTLVGVLGMSVAVTIGALAFTAVAAVTGTALPLDEGDRIVAIDNIDLKKHDEGRETHLHDLAVWREGLRTVDDLGAYRTVDRNLITADAPPASVRVAEMTASGFRLGRVAPILGRYLNTDDEQAGAPEVVVIGYSVWRNRFGGRGDVVGSRVTLGTVSHTVVGVMPEGFAFPVNNQMWAPLRLNPSAYERGNAPPIHVFGRLAPGASLDDASRQLTMIGQRLTAAYPTSHENIRPRMLLYARSFLDSPGTAWLLHLGQVAISLLLVVIGTNVAVLVYARTASRDAEMAVRTALGASRRRIVTQLFAEALVLSAVASVVGLVVAHFVFQRLEAMVRQSADDQIPFWMRLEITPSVMVYVAGLAVLAAVIIGVIPGLKATRHRVSANLQQHFGGASMRLGRTWTALLVTQVAVSVAALPVAVSGGKGLVRSVLVDRSTPATESFVMATPLPDERSPDRRDDKARRAHYTDRVIDLARRLGTEPNGFDVVLMSAPPGAESFLRIDIDPMAGPSTPNSGVTRAEGEGVVDRVDARFFAAFDVRALSGRMFTPGDFAAGTPTLIVNRSFVHRYFGDGNALGRRVRPSPPQGTAAKRTDSRPEPWWEIVGVVEDFPSLAHGPKMYLPLRPAEVYPMTLGVRARTGAPAAVADRIREVGMAVDPTLRFTTIRPLQDALDDEVRLERLAILGIVMVTLSVVLLSAAGIYALMSFTVARRRREIGIRMALGARSGRVVVEILASAMRQIGIGIAIGVAGTGILGRTVGGDSDPLSEFLVLLLGVGVMMVIVGVIATIGPARRALRVQPTELLRSE